MYFITKKISYIKHKFKENISSADCENVVEEICENLFIILNIKIHQI